MEVKILTWEIFIGITVLFAFIVSIGKIISNNTQSMTEMKCSIDNLSKLLSDYHDDVEGLNKEVKEISDRLTKLELVQPTVSAE